MQIIGSSKTDRVAKALAASDAALWAQTQIRLPGGEPFSFAKHLYQIEPLSLDHPNVCCRKASQGGWTLLFLLKELFMLVTRKFCQGAIHFFPTDDKVGAFSQLRFVPLVDANPVSLGAHLAKTNNVHNRQIGTAALMFRGMQLNTQISGVAKESVALRADPSDMNVYDERDLMPANALGKARGRLGHSAWKWEWSLSNPTIPHYGIDREYEESDQRHWMIRCPACNAWWSPDIEFPAILRRLADGRVLLACLTCGHELDIDQGQWVAKYHERSKTAVGYWWSRLNSHFETPAAILAAWEHPPENNIADVYRYVLGRAYLEAQYGLSANDVLLCCTPELPASSSLLPTVMGVDVGKQLHVLIGQRLTADSLRILTALLVDSFDELAAVGRAFNVEVTAIDNEPEIRAAREYQGRGPGQIWLSDYIDSVLPAAYDETTRVVKVNRTEILDATHYYIRTPGKLWLPAPTEVVKMFADHCAALAKVVEKNPKTGDVKGVYVQTGPADHFRHAFANLILAARRQTPIQYRSTQNLTGAPGAQKPGWNLFG